MIPGHIASPRNDTQPNAARDDLNLSDFLFACGSERPAGPVGDKIGGIDKPSHFGAVSDHLIERCRQPDATASLSGDGGQLNLAFEHGVFVLLDLASSRGIQIESFSARLVQSPQLK